MKQTKKPQKLVAFIAEDSRHSGRHFHIIRAVVRVGGETLATMRWQSHWADGKGSDWYGCGFDISSSNFKSYSKLESLKKATRVVCLSESSDPRVWFEEMKAHGFRHAVWDSRESEYVPREDVKPSDWRKVAAKAGEKYLCNAMAAPGMEESALRREIARNMADGYVSDDDCAAWVNGGKKWEVTYRGDEKPSLIDLAGMLKSPAELDAEREAEKPAPVCDETAHFRCEA